MKTYTVEDEEGNFAAVVALSPIDALHKFVESLDSTPPVETKVIVCDDGTDEQPPLDEEHVFYISQKRVEYTATRTLEHLGHLDLVKCKIVEVLGDSIPCARCEGKEQTCISCDGYGVISNETVTAAEEYHADLRDFRDSKMRL